LVINPELFIGGYGDKSFHNFLLCLVFDLLRLAFYRALIILLLRLINFSQHFAVDFLYFINKQDPVVAYREYKSAVTR
jgi:hypothetical protein